MGPYLKVTGLLGSDARPSTVSTACRFGHLQNLQKIGVGGARGGEEAHID